MMTVSAILRVLRAGLAKGHDAVGDRLDAGHGGAAVGEGLQQHPEPRYCTVGGSARHAAPERMAAGRKGLVDTYRDQRSAAYR